MRIVITGATGLIGSALSHEALNRGNQVVALSRDEYRARSVLGDGVEIGAWSDPLHEPPPAPALEGADAVVHLLGEPVAQRWSAGAKERIRDSRLLSTRNLVRTLAELPEAARPKTLVSQSATGYYGARGDEALDEAASPGDDFLAQVTMAWEGEAQAATTAGIRVVSPRTGVVISPSGGALAKMLPPFRLGLGGPVGGGKQFVPWIHLDDVVGALLYCASESDAAGAVNLTAPAPVTNAELSHTLGRVLHRPAVLPVPGLAVKLLYGEMAMIVTSGQRVIPARLQQLGYRFAYAELEPALRDVLTRS